MVSEGSVVTFFGVDAIISVCESCPWRMHVVWPGVNRVQISARHHISGGGNLLMCGTRVDFREVFRRCGWEKVCAGIRRSVRNDVTFA